MSGKNENKSERRREKQLGKTSKKRPDWCEWKKKKKKEIRVAQDCYEKKQPEFHEIVLQGGAGE